MMQAIGAFLGRAFTNPWMLAALAAVLIPIIIEWLFRKRKRLVDLPTIRFLLRTKEQEKIRRQDRLLLLLRMFALFLLVLAVARPLIRRGWLGPGGQRQVIALIDGTASNQQEVDMKQAFLWAQKKAADVIRELPRDAVVTVACLDDRVNVVIEGATDVVTAAAQVMRLRPGCGAAPMIKGIQWVTDYTKEKKISKAEVYIFSDFQKYTWINKAASAPEMAKAINEVASHHEVYFVDVGGEPKYNYVVTDLRPEEWIVTAGMPTTFIASVRTIGTPPKEAKATVTFAVHKILSRAEAERAAAAKEKEKDTEKGKTGDEESVASKGTQDICPSVEPQEVRFQYQFPGPGEYCIEVFLRGDEHEVDNRRLYICKVPDDVNVLILDETAVGDNPMPESVFLARAIAPPVRAPLPKVSRFSTYTVHPSRIIYENLNTYAAVILTGSGFLREEMVNKLEAYVRDGGAVWFFMGQNVIPVEYNKFFYKDGKGLLPCRLDRRVSVQTGGAEAKEAPFPAFSKSGHPTTAAIPDVIGTKDAVWKTYMAFDVKAPGASEGRVVLALSDGTPAVVEKEFGRGRVLLTNTTAGVEWTMLPARYEFPMFVQDVLRYLVGNPDRPYNLEVGDRFQTPVFVSYEHLLLSYPDKRKVRLSPREQPGVKDAWFLAFDDTTQQGLYEISGQATEQALPRSRFVVNQRASAEESDLARLTESDFKQAFTESGWQWVRRKSSLADLVSKLHTVTEVAPGLLWMLGAVLCIESFLAARFGRRRSAVVPESRPPLS